MASAQQAVDRLTRQQREVTGFELQTNEVFEGWVNTSGHDFAVRRIANPSAPEGCYGREGLAIRPTEKSLPDAEKRLYASRCCVLSRRASSQMREIR